MLIRENFTEEFSDAQTTLKEDVCYVVYYVHSNSLSIYYFSNYMIRVNNVSFGTTMASSYFYLFTTTDSTSLWTQNIKYIYIILAIKWYKMFIYIKGYTSCVSRHKLKNKNKTFHNKFNNTYAIYNTFTLCSIIQYSQCSTYINVINHDNRTHHRGGFGSNTVVMMNSEPHLTKA